jgi:F like protein
MPLVRTVRKTAPVPPLGLLSPAEQRLARVSRQALEALSGSISADRLARILADNPLSTVSAIDFTAMISALAPARSIIAAETSNAANAHATRMHLDLSFDSVDPNVVRSAELGSGRMIKHVTETTREGIRRVVTVALATQALTVPDVAKVVQLSIGLTPRQTLSVNLVYGRTLQEALDRGVKPTRAAQIGEAAAKKARTRAIKSRAGTIARTEIMTAQNAGKMVTWRGAHADGLIRDGTTKEWVATSEGACDICGPLDGTRVPWDGEFNRIGEMPPAHPSCRCTAVLRQPHNAG